MKAGITFLTLQFLLFACAKPEKTIEASTPVVEANQFKLPPATLVQAIQEEFPGALPYEEGIDSLVAHLERVGIPANTILWGQSTCVDDITNTKDKFFHPEIKGPFNFGGLAGLPFTGITGLDAFAHHVPEHGTALLFIGPHIGYDAKDGWGKIIRHEQHHASSCCGALSAALAKLQKGELKQQVPTEEDYQQGVLEQLTYQHREELLSAKEPLVALTKLTYLEAKKQMTTYVPKVKERHFKYAVVVGGIIINTNYDFPDYLWIERISILDIQKNVWVEGGKLIE